MHIETWQLVVVSVLAVVGALSLLRDAGRFMRERSAINKAMPLLMELTGKSERVVRAELRAQWRAAAQR